jgi:hypothetical protein
MLNRTARAVTALAAILRHPTVASQHVLGSLTPACQSASPGIFGHFSDSRAEQCIFPLPMCKREKYITHACPASADRDSCILHCVKITEMVVRAKEVPRASGLLEN